MKNTSLPARLIAATTIAASLVFAVTGCAVARDQETVGSYVDDTGITTKVKAKFAEDKVVSAMAISVETLNGVVQLSGFAKTEQERVMAERLARDTKNVVQVKNDIIVRY